MVEYLRSLKPIILVRHGQSPSNIDPKVGDWQDKGLTKLGLEQAECVAQRLKSLLKDRKVNLYSSHLKRAYLTAKIIDSELQCGLTVEEELEEYRTNLQPSISRPEAEIYKTINPEPSKNWRTFIESESLAELYARAGKVLEMMLLDNSDAIVLVSHGWMIDRMIAWWLRISVDDIRPNMFATANASISVLSITQYGDRVLMKLNDTSHLQSLSDRPSILT